MIKDYRKFLSLPALLCIASAIGFLHSGISGQYLFENDRSKAWLLRPVEFNRAVAERSGVSPAFENLFVNFFRDFPTVALPTVGNLTTTTADPLASEIDKIVNGDESNGFGAFGSSLAVSGDTLVIGSPRDTIGGNQDAGAVYVYIRSGNSWAFQQKLFDPNAGVSDQFGFSVDIDGDTIIVSANNADIGQNFSQGAAFVFVRTGGVWTQQQKFVAADGAQSDFFGQSVAISGDTAIVGAHQNDAGGNTNRGAIYIFQRTGGVWGEPQKVVAADGSAQDNFGWSVDLSGDTAIVGAHLKSVITNDTRGAAYVFTKTGSVWSQQAKLTANDAFLSDRFGYSVAIDGDTAVIGANAVDIGSNVNQGAAYIFTRSSNAWSQSAKLFTPDGQGGDSFGSSVAIDGGRVVVGAINHNPGGPVRIGAAFLYLKVGESWIQRAELIELDYFGSLVDRFGTSVAIEGDDIFAGAPSDDYGVFLRRGSVYYYRTPVFAPDLQPGSDSGTSSTDNMTKNQQLVFDISGVTPGAAVDLLRDNAVVASGAATGTTITLSDTAPSADGTFRYTARETRNGVTNSPSDWVIVRVDNTAPAATINQAVSQLDPYRLQPINFTASFNEPVFGFAASDISLAGSTAGVSSSLINVSGNGPVYNVGVGSLTADGNVTASILANAAEDAAGNQSVASTSTDNTVTYDSTPPTVTINQSANQADPTGILPVNFTVSFSEPVTDFNAADISLAGSTANIESANIFVSGGGATYNVAISNITSNGGFVQASVNAPGAVDAAGNPNAASTSTDNRVAFDNMSPSVTINQAAEQPDPTSVLPVNFTVVFSEPVTGFEAADVNFIGSTFDTTQASVSVTGTGTTYNVSVGGVIVSNGSRLEVRVSSGTVRDALGNLNFASTSTDNRVTIDNVAPTVTVNQAIGQSDPASTQPVNFTVRFSEAVAGLTSADISLAGSTADVEFAAVTVTVTGNLYSVAVRNITSNGQVRVSLPPGAAADSVGNLSQSSTSTDNVVTVAVKDAPFDFDGDGKTDVGIFRSSDGSWWYARSSSTDFRVYPFGVGTDIITPGDYTGDGKADIAVFRPSNGEWFIQRSEDGSYFSFPFGQAGDVPVPADYDADGKTDAAIFRPSTGTWYILNSGGSGTGIVNFGASTDKPVPADYDGDGKADVAIFRPSDGSWWYLRSSDSQFRVYSFGVGTDIPVPGDWTGDGKADIAVFRPGNGIGEWFFQRSEDNSYYSVPFGASTDIPAPGDYDGDGKFDTAVFRPSTGNWFIQGSSAGITITSFGGQGDRPIPNAFVP